MSKLSDYHKEVTYLRKSFSETKKTEIKNKILEVKDYIRWTRTHPADPLTEVLAGYIAKLQHADLSNSIKDNLNQPVKDSICHAQIPIYIVSNNKKIVYAYCPLREIEELSDKGQTAILCRVQKETNTPKSILTYYRNPNTKDSTLASITYFDKTILPGFTVLTTLSRPNFDHFLQEYILDSLSRLRYSKDDYIFINTMTGKALVSNGKRNKQPPDILASGNVAWKDVFNMEQQSANHSAGLFYTYAWPKISASKIAKKTSYFGYLPEWQWIIGTGFYEDDINAVIELKRKALYADMRKSIWNGIAFLILSIVLSYVIALFFSKKLKKNIELFKVFFEKASWESDLIDKSQVSYKEFENMADAANHMVEEREKAKAELLKSEEKFLKAFKNSPDAIIITSVLEGYIFDANESTARITGYSLNEILGNTTMDLDFWMNMEARNRYVNMISKYGRIENFEADLRMKSGEVRNGLFSGEIIQLGNNMYILNVIRDITERKRVEKSLQLSEERYRFLFEHNPASMLIYERDTYKILSVNEAFLTHYGYSSDELLSMILPDLYPEKEKKLIVELAHNLKGHAYVGEWHHIKKDGSEITIIVTSHDVFHMGKEARIAVITDITERKQAEEKVQFSQQQLSLIFDNVFDAIYLLGVEENEFRFLSVNRTFLRLTGIEETQIVNKRINEIIPEPSRSMVIENYKRLWRGNKLFSGRRPQTTPLVKRQA